MDFASQSAGTDTSSTTEVGPSEMMGEQRMGGENLMVPPSTNLETGPVPGGGGGGLRCFPGRIPAKIRPGRPIFGPEALLRNIEYVY